MQPRARLRNLDRGAGEPLAKFVGERRPLPVGLQRPVDIQEPKRVGGGKHEPDALAVPGPHRIGALLDRLQSSVIPRVFAWRSSVCRSARLVRIPAGF